MSFIPSKCDSQNSAQGCSILLSACETPDVRNWFSSYVYESPALTGELGGSVLKGGEGEKEGLSIRKSIDEEEKFNEGFIQVKKNACIVLDDTISSDKRSGHDDVKISAASCSIPLSSAETPDLENWFSSYVYESPALTDDFRVSGLGVTERKKEGSTLEDTKNEEENFSKTTEANENAHVCISKAKSSNGRHENKHDRLKNLDYSDSPFVLSEPPHISNWFSSYIYESPELTFFDESRKSSFKEDKQYSTDGIAIGSKLESVLHQSPSDDLYHQVPSLDEEENLIIEDSCEPADSFLTKLNHPRTYFRRTTGQKVIADNGKGNVVSSLKENGYLQKLKQDRSSEVIITSPNTNKDSWHADVTSPLNSSCSVHISEQGSDMNSLKTNRVALESKLSSSRDMNCGNDEKEDKERNVDKNGFVSIRKKGGSLRKDENNLTRRILNGCSNGSRENVSPTIAKDGVKRNPLSEITNFQCSNVMEIGGKWQCPQKGKPNLGPPMKQLRLEKWIHRV